jgi:histidinol-phosphate phosphatase family protein
MPAAIFLDRDGVINENRDDYVTSWQEIRFIPGVLQALARLAATPFHIVLVTNQSPIGRGILTRAQVEAINRRLVAQIEAHGGRMDRVYYCPHRPDEGCDCRKPRPGLLLQAGRELNVDLGKSYLVGDAVSDVEAALAAGVQPVMVRTGRGAVQERLLQVKRPQVPVMANLSEALEWILSTTQMQDTKR